MNRFEVKGGMRVSNQVPFDKFTQENIDRTTEYIALLMTMDSRRIKFGDEKSLKGREIFNRKVRRCPITGVVESIIVDPDFRNAYSIIGFCGIDPRTVPFDFYINEGTNDAEDFSDAVEMAVLKGFLLPGDVLILDNASIHRFKEAESLEDWLWDNFYILLIFLPTRSPELNPIELLWHILVARLKNWDLNGPRPYHDAAAYAAAEIMTGFTHTDVAACYQKCNYCTHF
jgi:hypothetical protein